MTTTRQTEAHRALLKRMNRKAARMDRFLDERYLALRTLRRVARGEMRFRPECIESRDMATVSAK